MKQKIIFKTAFFLVLLMSVYLMQAQDSEQSMKEEIDKIFSNWNQMETPGASVSVVKDGKLYYSNGYGSANLEYDIPITPTTVFHAASLSKQFTAFAILLLEDEGKLSLDDDVRKYIPELPDFGAIITLKHLASHSSGLRDQWRLLEMAGWRLEDVITTRQILDLVKKQKALNFLPGDENLYSNTGFTLLAEVVARVSGKTFSEFTKVHIFDPLGMTNTQFYDNHQKIVRNRAYSYEEHNKSYKKNRLNFSTVGPTSLFTTANDMALWAMNFQNPIVGNKSIFQKLNLPPDLNYAKGKGYALGQMRGTYQGLNVFVHSGSDAGYRAYFVRVPDYNLSVTVLANLSSINPIEQAFGVVNLFLSDYFEALETQEKTVFKPDPKTFISLSKEALAKFERTYFEPIEGYTRKIYIKNDTLMYYRSKNSESKLVPIKVNTFKMLGDTEEVTVVFNNNNNGEPQLEFYINNEKPIIMLAKTEVNLSPYQGTFYSEELDTYYTILIDSEILIVKHLRLDGIELKPIQKDVFTSNNRNFKSVKFIRDAKDSVIGFSVSNSGARNVKFKKN